MQCTNPKCKSQWNTKADVERGQYYPADDECPDCGNEGHIIDFAVDLDAWADNQYDTMVEEGLIQPREVRRVA
jgi:hypothetical protein